tara:strand:- start:1732 stop:3276 length:1545 start_codon:yes stop_codon:yes gene_type:complete
LKKKIVLDSLFLFFLGALSSFGLPPINFFFVNFFTFSAFFIFLFNKNKTKSNNISFFYYGWTFGFGYFLTNLYWVTISLTFDPNFFILIPLAQILIPASLAIFYGFFSLSFFFIKPKSVLSAFFLFTLLFGLTEFIRGNIFTGFPWNLISYSFSENLNLIRIISIIGTYSFNLVIISFFTAPAIFFLKKSKKEIVVLIIFLLLPIIFSVYGSIYKRNYLIKDLQKNPIKIRVVGSNVSIDRFYDVDQTKYIVNELIELSSPDPNIKTFFLWPEGIISEDYQDEIYLYKNLFLKSFNENHLIGLGMTRKSSSGNKDEYFNSFTIFDNNLNLIHNYDKINLVPFGEFIPFENFFEIIGLKVITSNFGSFSKGKSRKIIQIENGDQRFRLLPLICYEIIYSGNLTKNFEFDYILNISEDGWFGKSIGPKQHFVHSRFRAIENGKYVIRSSNNGMSAIINPLGEIEQKIDYGEDGFIDFEESRRNEPTIFSLYGNNIFLIIILLYIFLVFSFNRIKNE